MHNLSSFDDEFMSNLENLKNDTMVIIGSASVGIISKLVENYFFNYIVVRKVKTLNFDVNGTTYGINYYSPHSSFNNLKAGSNELDKYQLFYINSYGFNFNDLHPAEFNRLICEIKKENSSFGNFIKKNTDSRPVFVISTSNPLFIDEFDAEDVFHLSVNKLGLSVNPVPSYKLRRLSEAFNFKNRGNVYYNGEMWLSYCDNENDEKLFYSSDLDK